MTVFNYQMRLPYHFFKKFDFLNHGDNLIVTFNLQVTMKRSICPITNLLDVVGDKWTLIIIRDLFLGKRRYVEFIGSKEKIPTNILAERLKRIEEFGLVTKNPYQTNPMRFEYSLTEKGKALEPILNEMARWGLHYIKGTKLFLKVSSEI